MQDALEALDQERLEALTEYFDSLNLTTTLHVVNGGFHLMIEVPHKHRGLVHAFLITYGRKANAKLAKHYLHKVRDLNHFTQFGITKSAPHLIPQQGQRLASFIV